MRLNERVKNAIIGASFFATDLISASRFDTYNSEFDIFVQSYGHNILQPLSLYFFYNALGGLWNINKYATAAFIFSGCSAFEIAQGVGLYKGTFDPMDFVAYATGTALALGIDALISKKSEKEEIKYSQKQIIPTQKPF